MVLNMKRGIMEFEETAKFILAVVVLVFAIMLAYILKDKIIEAIKGLRL